MDESCEIKSLLEFSSFAHLGPLLSNSSSLGLFLPNIDFDTEGTYLAFLHVTLKRILAMGIDSAVFLSRQSFLSPPFQQRFRDN